MMYNARLFLRARRFIVRASPELKFRTTDEAYTAHMVSGLPTARKQWYIFSPDFLQIATFLACNARAQYCLFWINAECICRRRFHYSLSFVLFLSKGANKAKIVWHLTYRYCYKFWLWTYYCCVIYFSTIFFFSKLFSNIFFQNVFFNIFFPKFFFQTFFSNFFFQNLFSQMFFPKLIF